MRTIDAICARQAVNNQIATCHGNLLREASRFPIIKARRIFKQVVKLKKTTNVKKKVKMYLKVKKVFFSFFHTKINWLVLSFLKTGNLAIFFLTMSTCFSATAKF